MSTSIPGCPRGISPNPDISGIGVRTAIYAQAVLTLIQPILASLDGRISEDELAIIQARTFGLSVYHGVIVLNLSWINNTSALIFFEFSLIAQLKLEKDREFRRQLGHMLALVYTVLETVMNRVDKSYASSEAVKVQDAFKLAVGEVSRVNSELKKAKSNTKLDASREILENVAQGLQLVELYGNMILQRSINGTLKNGDDEVQTLKHLIEQDKTRLPKSLGVHDIGPSTEKGVVIRTLQRVSARCNQLIRTIPGGKEVLSLLRKDWVMAALASGHLILFAAFGLWLWFTIHHFGINLECEAHTHLSLVVHDVPVTSPALHHISLLIYLVSSLPVINVVILGILEVAAIHTIQRIAALFQKPANMTASFIDSPYSLYQFIALTLLVQVYFITSTELTIRSNGSLLNEDEEGKWTFGQTLAVALTVIPLVQVADEIRKTWKITQRGKEKVVENQIENRKEKDDGVNMV